MFSDLPIYLHENTQICSWSYYCEPVGLNCDHYYSQWREYHGISLQNKEKVEVDLSSDLWYVGMFRYVDMLSG